MKLFLLTLLISSSALAGYVRGYYRSNGTYVNGYYRSSPDSSIYNNYSTYPNINPYTGQEGTKYKLPVPSTSLYGY